MNRIYKRTLSIILCLCLLFGGASFASSAQTTDNTITRVSCTFSADSGTSRNFCWYTKTKTGSDVQIIKAADLRNGFDGALKFSGDKVTKFRGEYCHKVTAAGLEAGTYYAYRVGDAKLDLWSENGTFITDDGDSSFSFLTIADVQASSDENFAHAAETMKAAIATDPNAEFTVNLGDFVNDDTNDEWDWFFKNFAFSNMNTTLAPVAGNHDGNITNKLNINVFNSMFNLTNPNTDSLVNWVNGVYYSFDYGNAHFTVLNTNDMYPMTQSQRNWIINDAKNSDADWKIVLMHRAAYSVGKNINKPDTVIMRDVLLPLFDEADIDLVYAGHDHTYYRSKQVKGDKPVENVTYVTKDYKGEQIEFAVDPEGSVHICPSTAGTKRYVLYEGIDPITECAAFEVSTRDLGGCFTTTTIDGNKLIVKSYAVNDETQEITEIDRYAIEKDISQSHAEASNLSTSNAVDLQTGITNFVNAFMGMLYKYLFVLLPQAIRAKMK
ncbi:MAG: metallophosphoesterase family protein [Clostridiales bacterium]|nr:metallophosphoesterase family protein [Clostridiales bacterium]